MSVSIPQYLAEQYRGDILRALSDLPRTTYRDHAMYGFYSEGTQATVRWCHSQHFSPLKTAERLVAEHSSPDEFAPRGCGTCGAREVQS